MLKHIKDDIIIDEWLEDLELDQEEANYPKLRRWFVDASRQLQLKDNIKHKIALLHTDLGKAELPENLESIMEVAYRKPIQESCTTADEIKGFVQPIWGEDCDLEVYLKCDKCKKTKCSCNEPVIDLEVDYAFLQHNPWYSGKATRYGQPGSLKDNRSKYTPHFKLMQYSENSFHNLNFHIPTCENLTCKGCDHTYTIDYPYIRTDIMENGTELLITYRAHQTDEKGTLMCPDTPSAIEAVKAYLTYKHMSGIAARTMQDQFENKADRARARYERLHTIALSELEQMPYNKLWTVLEGNLVRHRNWKRARTAKSKRNNHLWS